MLISFKHQYHKYDIFFLAARKRGKKGEEYLSIGDRLCMGEWDFSRVLIWYQVWVKLLGIEWDEIERVRARAWDSIGRKDKIWK